jgi:anti-sigma regulatory factor (Ser/Thr protein kinase)
VGEGGLGLLLTRKAARECRYQRIDGRNRFTVVLDR